MTPWTLQKETDEPEPAKRGETSYMVAVRTPKSTMPKEILEIVWTAGEGMVDTTGAGSPKVDRRFTLDNEGLKYLS